LHHGEGVWGFGKDAEIERPKALQDAKPTKRSYSDREFALFYKKRFFLQTGISFYGIYFTEGNKKYDTYHHRSCRKRQDSRTL
ncbi:MAG: hypothetical protein EGR74_03920, partial [Ruminiclostridium sp.]|nr:hypothetical protein [Ruminiclostridium sp.]